MQSLINWLEQHMMPCFYKQHFGIECPGCGMQRAFIALLRGNLWESLVIYPALLPTIFLLIFLILHLIFNFKYGAAILKYTFIFTVAIQVISYIYKLI